MSCPHIWKGTASGVVCELCGEEKTLDEYLHTGEAKRHTVDVEAEEKPLEEKPTEEKTEKKTKRRAKSE